MLTREAIRIVLDLAEQNALDPTKVDDELQEEAMKQALALSKVRHLARAMGWIRDDEEEKSD
jgi:hypothetical protein